MKSEKRKSKDYKKIIRQNINKSYLLLIALALFIVFVGYRILVQNSDYTGLDLLTDVIGNLIGVLVAFIFFDIINEKLTKDSYAEEISRKIMETLMGNPETLDSFDADQRRTFIYNTISSMIDDKMATEMVCYQLSDYLIDVKDYSIRPEFNYDFVLSSSLPQNYGDCWDRSEYFYVQERLTYKVKFLNPSKKNINFDDVRVGFVFDNRSLDNVLRGEKIDSDFENCIFRESLDIDIENINSIKSDDVKNGEWDSSYVHISKFQELFKLDVHIDNQRGDIIGIKVLSNGIVVKLKMEHVESDTHQVRIAFYMPKRWGSILEVAIVDPTRGPKISVSYDENAMDVDMFSFLGSGEESSYEVAQEQVNGNYNITLDKEWIYPVSGLVFNIRKNMKA